MELLEPSRLALGKGSTIDRWGEAGGSRGPLRSEKEQGKEGNTMAKINELFSIVSGRQFRGILDAAGCEDPALTQVMCEAVVVYDLADSQEEKEIAEAVFRASGLTLEEAREILHKFLSLLAYVTERVNPQNIVADLLAPYMQRTEG